MKRLLIICGILVSLILTGCEDPFLISFSEHEPDPYDGELTWLKESYDAGYSNRYDHASAVFDDAIWVFGGYDSTVRGAEDCYQEDIWKSADGKVWELITETAPWNGRRGHAVAEFEGYLYLVGGFSVDESTGLRGYTNDVWRSADGEEWELVTDSAPWGVRMNHALYATDDALYLVGGFYDGHAYRSDMWKYDGISWSELSCGIPGERAGFASCVGDDGRFYLQGGSFSGTDESSSGHVDDRVAGWQRLWVFDPEDEAAGWEPLAVPTNNATRRAEHVIIPYDGRIWLFAGKSNSGWRFSRNSATYSTEVYDPVTDSWSHDSDNTGFGPRYSYSAEVLETDGKQTLLILGGFSNDGPNHDIWYVGEAQ